MSYETFQTIRDTVGASAGAALGYITAGQRGAKLGYKAGMALVNLN